MLERDASGAPVRVRVLDRADDVEGEGWRYSRLGETEADVEGHPYRWILHEGEADAEGHVLVIGEGIPATERIQGRTFVVEDDVRGQGFRYGG